LEQEAGDIRPLLALWLDTGCKPSRCDVAIDDREGILTPERIEACVTSGLAVSRWRTSAPRTNTKLSTGQQEEGWTRYFGSPQSRMLLRVYDKQAERISKGHADPGHWMRVEFQGRKERAKLLAKALLVDEPGELVCGLLRGYLEFKQKPEDDRDTNRSRWEAQPWWREFLEDAAKRKVGVAQPEKTIERAAAWFVRQVAPVYALLRLASEYGEEWLEEQLDKGARRLQKWQVHALGIDTGTGLSLHASPS
jgi:DNA relaxase NicK